MSAMKWCEGGVMLDRIAGVETSMVSTGVTRIDGLEHQPGVIAV
jgi:hypothetical protein